MWPERSSCRNRNSNCVFYFSYGFALFLLLVLFHSFVVVFSFCRHSYFIFTNLLMLHILLSLWNDHFMAHSTFLLCLYPLGLNFENGCFIIRPAICYSLWTVLLCNLRNWKRDTPYWTKNQTKPKKKTIQGSNFMKLNGQWTNTRIKMCVFVNF